MDKFNSCSCDELRNCLIARIFWIREAKRFLKSDNSKDFPTIRFNARISILTNQLEIRHIVRVRGVRLNENEC